jgi:hypothetical protein
MANFYSNLGESGRAAENARKAYQLHEKVSYPERFFIDAIYYIDVTVSHHRPQVSRYILGAL